MPQDDRAMNYGVALNGCEQYFELDWNEVYYYLDPLDEGHVGRTLQPVENEHSSIGEPVQSSTTDKSSGDCFSGLPKELVLCILDFVSAPDLASCLLASRAILEATESNQFWNRRIRLDAPWYWEIAEDSSSGVHLEMHQKYNDIMSLALEPAEMASRGKRMFGLANRVRVWQNAQEIVGFYKKASGPTERL
ncbi:hypothetical protein B0A50_03392 [Salinomyces thailandicus]|uniref:F-box domain-containing protein n=1 Tax=Salinomyces thailandicus TaxID=706561 RepID=A0A4U0U202_9PEZI|nr:hypothetical protein B0A50_03392 [Salinomyces thailandica]